MKSHYISFLILIGFLTVSCSNQDKKFVLQGEAQGTTFSLIYFAKEDKQIKSRVSQILNDIDESLSTYQKSSYISKWNRGEQLDTLNHYFEEMYLLSKTVYDKTNGFFDPTVQPLSQFYGFEKKENFLPNKIDSILEFVGLDKLTHAKSKIEKGNVNIKLNYNAIAQGYTVDVIVDNLYKWGINNFIFELGGEVYCSGNKPDGGLWVIGVDKPKADRDGEFQSYVKLSNMAITTSGNYRKWKENPTNGKKYTHTINPMTGESSPSDLLSVTVIDKSCALADAYSTALLSMKYDNAVQFLQSHKIPVLFILEKDNRIVIETFNDFSRFE